jgi:hypothetical protein
MKTYPTRREAFEHPAPEGWVAQFEQEVYLPPRSPFLLVGRGVVTRTLAHDVVVVTYRYGGRNYHRQLSASDLRPTGLKVEWNGRTANLVRIDGRQSKRAAKRIWCYPGFQ